MKTLLITSSSMEFNAIAKTFKKLKCLHEERLSYNGSLGEVIFLNSGTGMVAMAYTLTKEIQNGDYDLLVNAGICGSFRRELPPGTLVMVQQEVFGDFGSDSPGGFLDIFDMGLGIKNMEPYEEGKIFHQPGDYVGLFKGIKTVSGITVNKVTGTREGADNLAGKYSSDIESMEGAAFFYVCRKENLNFVQLRAVSNFVGPRDRSAWKIDEAITALSSALYEIFK